jgi:glycosyltransferase involved in cell wall biosynthesis
LKVCFVAHFAYGALTGDPHGHIGGVERQTALMSRWLADRGHSVSVCTWTEDVPDDETRDGIRIIKICRRDAGVPGIRFFHPRWSGLCAAMRRADAQLYYQNCAEATTGQVALWAHHNRRRFVYSVASDPECDPELPIFSSLRERVLYRRGLELADGIITQTDAQREMLKRGFGVEASTLPMPSDICVQGNTDSLEAERDQSFRVLWIGRLMPVKRPEFLFAVARALPAVRFDLIGGTDQDGDYSVRVMAEGQKIPNLRLYGRMDRSLALAYFRRSHVLCCTSSYEGFPNTFLEAFAHGMPVVSTVDPGRILNTQAIGMHCDSVDSLVTALRKYATDPVHRRSHGANARHYYNQQHALPVAMPRFEQFLIERH